MKRDDPFFHVQIPHFKILCYTFVEIWPKKKNPTTNYDVFTLSFAEIAGLFSEVEAVWCFVC